MPRVSVDIVGDANSLRRAVRSSAASLGVLGREYTTVGVTATNSARLQVEAAVRTDARLRTQIRDYRAVANAAAKGSREQVVATNLAARAEQRLARSLSVTASEARIHARALTTSERSLGRLGRGAIAGSGAFRGLGRSLAFASSSFLGGAGLAFALRSTISAAAQSQLVNVQLARSLQAVGLSYAANRDQINQTIEAQAKLSAFDDEDLKQSFTTLARRTGDVNKALQLNALAADIARARSITLQQSSILLIRAMAGNARAATTLGLPLADLGKHATKAAVAQSILASAQARYAGQAAAFGRTAAGAQGRFNKTLQDSEEIIGGALIPVLARLATRTANYLDRINKTGQLQRNVNTAIHTAGQVFAALRDILNGVRAVLGPVNNLLGGTKNTIKTLLAVMVLGKVRRFAIELGILETSAAAAAGAGGIGGLTTKLLALRSIGPLVIPVTIAIAFKRALGSDAPHAAAGPLDFLNNLRHPGRLLNDLGNFNGPIGRFLRLPHHSRDDTVDVSLSATGEGPGVHGALLANVRRRERARLAALRAVLAAQQAAARVRVRAENAVARGLSLFEIAATRARLTRSLTDDQRNLRDEETFLRREIRNHLLSAKRRLDLRQRLADVEVQLAQNQQEIAQRAQEARQKALERRNTRQFRVLGLDASGSPLAPSRAALRRELGSISDAVKGTFLDTGKTRNLMRSIRRLLSGEFGALSADVRNTIKGLLDNLQSQFGDFDAFNLTQADKRRRVLDQQRADRFGGKADHPVIGSSTVNNTYNINAKDPNDWVKASKRINWRMANA
jgi:hypothetical protein